MTREVNLIRPLRALYATHGYDPDADYWGVSHPADRARVITERNVSHTEVLSALPYTIAATYGGGTDEFYAAEIFSILGQNANIIAADQLRGGLDGRNGSWEYYSPEATRKIAWGIRYMLSAKRYSRFFDRCPEFRETLLALYDLKEETDPDILLEKALKIEHLAAAGHVRGQPVLFADLDTSYLIGDQKLGEKWPMWLMNLLLVYSLPSELKSFADRVNEDAWQTACEAYDVGSNLKRPDNIIGFKIGSGFELFSEMMGMSLRKKGVFIDWSMLAKHVKRWGITSRLFGTSGTEEMFSPYFWAMQVHENGHFVRESTRDNNSPPTTQIFEEVLQDAFSVSGVLRKIASGGYADPRSFNRIFQPLPTVAVIVSEFVDELPCEGDIVGIGIYDGYKLSAAVVLNALTQNGVVRVGGERSILGVDASPEKLIRAANYLSSIFSGLLRNDPNVSGAVLTERANRVSQSIAMLFSNDRS